MALLSLAASAALAQADIQGGTQIKNSPLCVTLVPATNYQECLFPGLSAGTWNPLVHANDSAIILSAGSLNSNASFVIGPHTSFQRGLRFDYVNQGWGINKSPAGIAPLEVVDPPFGDANAMFGTSFPTFIRSNSPGIGFNEYFVTGTGTLYSASNYGGEIFLNGTGGSMDFVLDPSGTAAAVAPVTTRFSVKQTSGQVFSASTTTGAAGSVAGQYLALLNSNSGGEAFDLETSGGGLAAQFLWDNNNNATHIVSNSSGSTLFVEGAASGGSVVIRPNTGSTTGQTTFTSAHALFNEAVPASGTIGANLNNYAGVLGNSVGNDFPLFDVDMNLGNDEHIGFRSHQNVLGTTWTGLALGISYDVDATESAGGAIWFYNGNVGIGTTAPVAKLDINGSVNVSGTASSVAQPSWTNVSGGVGYVNSWVDVGGTNQPGSYFKDSNGFVHLRGAIKSGTIPTTAFTLPAGLRPSAGMVFAVNSSSAFGAIVVSTTGAVNVAVGNTASVQLDGIQFDTR